MDLNQSIDEVLGMLRSIVREDTRVKVEKRVKKSWIENDPNQIQHILLNLVANARDAMPQGGQILLVTDSISITKQDHQHTLKLPEGDYITLSVIDQGLGMPDPIVRKATEPFFTTKAEEGRGAGLGLTSVRAIVEQSSGAMEIQSKPNRGTTVCIFLPELRQKPENTQSSPEPHSSNSLDGLRVLVAESDAQLRRLIRRQLEKWGHVVLTASDQPAAETISETTPLDVLITDSQLPSCNGRTLARTLRARHPSLRTILMSRYAPNRAAAEGVSQGVEAILPKPFTMLDLRRSLEGLVSSAPPDPIKSGTPESK